MAKPLTHQDKIAAFKAATSSYSGSEERWRERARTGLSDKDLENALKYELCIAGGSSGYKGRPAIQHQSAGLKIWAGWDWPNSCIDQPIFSGQKTIDMARYVYGINQPYEAQMSLL